MKKTFIGLGILFIVLVASVFIRTAIYPFAKKEAVSAVSAPVKVSELSVTRFSKGLSFPTVSFQNYDEIDYKPFEDFRAFLQEAYPEIYKTVEYHTVNTHSMVLRWKGKNPKLNPILFLSHYDVVPPGDFNNDYLNEFREISIAINDQPAAPISEVSENWEFEPFSGAVSKGRIYGRGALDMKNMLFAIMESADTLIKSGFVPERDIYFAFGHDEEVGGKQGAKLIATEFEAKKLRFDAVYDEGGIIAASGSISGFNTDIALVGFAEKGNASLRIKVKGLGGHSSMPPLQSAMGKAAIIMRRLEDKQMKQVLIEPIADFLTNVGGAMSFSGRMAIANQWLFKPMLLSTLEKSPATNALTRTTTALTMMKGSDANNILPSVAEFVVNFRLLPGNTSAEVLAHVQKACEGFEVEIEPVRALQEASHISKPDSRAYDVLKESVKKLYPNAIVTPFVTIGGTDAIMYQGLSDHIYRLSPALLNDAEQRSIHNQNEYISIENFGKMIAHFTYVMKNFDKQ